MAPATYKSAGVDLELYDEAMARLPALMRRTRTPRVVELTGGFAGLFRLDADPRAFRRNYEEPLLVSGTDGVGTKLKVAVKAGRHDTVGVDLVAMSVNDCLCLGAEPLFFLDYIALGKDDPDLIAGVVKGVSDGCVTAGCALLGGETAIMPDIYQPGDYDLAGFCVGVVERRRVIDGKKIRPGDVLLGLASSGCHSNGYSLVRKIVFDIAGCGIDDAVPELGQTVGEALLTPTRIYARPILDVLGRYKKQLAVKGMAHITGGGLAGNLERILPAGCRAVVRRGSWSVPPVFAWLQRLGEVEQAEMEQVFNMGIGYVLVVGARFADSIQRRLNDAGVPTWVIGDVQAGETGVELV